MYPIVRKSPDEIPKQYRNTYRGHFDNYDWQSIAKA